MLTKQEIETILDNSGYRLVEAPAGPARAVDAGGGEVAMPPLSALMEKYLGAGESGGPPSVAPEPSASPAPYPKAPAEAGTPDVSTLLAKYVPPGGPQPDAAQKALVQPGDEPVMARVTAKSLSTITRQADVRSVVIAGGKIISEQG